MQVDDVGKLRDDQVQAICLFELFDLLFKLEPLEDLPHVFREAGDVVRKVPADVVGVALELGKIEFATVVKTEVLSAAGNVVQDRVELLGLSLLEFLVAFDDRSFGRLEDAIESAQHGHGKHDPLVLRWTIRATAKIGDLPDEVRQVLVRHAVLRQSTGIESFAHRAGPADFRQEVLESRSLEQRLSRPLQYIVASLACCSSRTGPILPRSAFEALFSFARSVQQQDFERGLRCRPKPRGSRCLDRPPKAPRRTPKGEMRDLPVMVHNRFLPDPIKYAHRVLKVVAFDPPRFQPVIGSSCLRASAHAWFGFHG